MKNLVATMILCVCVPFSASAEIPTPAETFGHEVGADYKMIPYPEVLSYLDTVAAASDRVSIEDAGRSTLDNPMKVVILTSPENQGTWSGCAKSPACSPSPAVSRQSSPSSWWPKAK